MFYLALYYYLWLLARGYNIPATTVFIFLIFIAHCENAFQGSRCIMKNCKATYILFNKIPLDVLYLTFAHCMQNVPMNLIQILYFYNTFYGCVSSDHFNAILL